MEGLWDWLKDSFDTWSLAKVYIACAIAGGTVVVAQFGLSLFGFGGADMDVDDVDVTDADAVDASDGLNLLSVRAVSGFLTLFGLAGWGGTAAGWPSWVAALVAFLAGSTAMLFVAFMMRMFKRLTESGSLVPEKAIGKSATVYLRVPAKRSGKGKITVSVQGRTVEFEAVTAGPELPTGAACRVVAQVAGMTFEVAPLEQPEG